MPRLLKVTAFKSLSYCGLVRTGRHSVVALVGRNSQQQRENHAQTSPVRTFTYEWIHRIHNDHDFVCIPRLYLIISFILYYSSTNMAYIEAMLKP